MSCAVVSVNRALCVLAVVWMVMPVGPGTTDTKTGTASASALELAAQAGHSELSPPHPPEPADPCKLDEAQGVLSPRCLASTQPNRKNARVTNGR